MAETRTTGTFNATGPARPLTMREMLAGVADGVGADAAPDLGPGRLPEAQQGLGLERPAGLGAGPGRHRRLRAARHPPRRCRPGLTFRPLATTAADTLAWFKAQPAERQAKLKPASRRSARRRCSRAWKASARGKR